MATSRRLITRAGLAATAALALALAGAGPAAAFPAGLVKTGTTSALNSSSAKTQFAPCPAGTVVTGGGGYLTAPAAAHQGRVTLDRLEPLADGSGFTAAMREVVAHPLNWQLSADALCVPKPAGWVVVQATGPIGTQVVQVRCPAGLRVLGPGGRINNGLGRVALDHVVPAADLASVTVRGTPLPGAGAANWSVTAFAVCARDDSLTRASFAAPTGSPASASLNWSCPAGKGLYGVGAGVSPGSGEVVLDSVHAVSTSSFSTRASEDASYLPNWTLTGYGVCRS